MGKGLKDGRYIPGGTYTFVYDISSYIPDYTNEQITVLQSNNYDNQYPSQWCNQQVYGASEKLVSEEISYKVSAANPVVTVDYGGSYAPTSKEFQDSTFNLDKPLRDLKSQATAFTSNMKFGLLQGDTDAACIEIEITENGTSVKWYRNNAVVATDTITHKIAGAISIGVVASGETVTGYVYLFNVGGTRGIWTSGLKSNAEVLTIINSRGYAGEDITLTGFTDEEKGDFVFSKIFDENGNDAYSGFATDYSSLSDSKTALVNKCAQFNGYVGTDLVEYMGGWNYIHTQAVNNTPVSVQIPTGVEGEFYTIKYNIDGATNPYFHIYDKNNTLIATLIQSVYEYETGSVYLTWYRQSQDISQRSRLCWVSIYRISYGGDVKYELATCNSLSDAELTEFDNESAFKDMIEGYDPESGQDDDPQDEPDDVDDPAYDPLASGFLYAFMLDSGDMENLADALVPESLAEKIRVDFGNNLYDFIVSYHMMPCMTNADSLNKVNILYRGNAFLYGGSNQLSLAPITKSFYTISCGTKMCIPKNVRPDGFENWAKANIQLYLPFIGYIHLNTADVWNKAITISYKFDVLQGTCVANIGVGSNGTIYSYEGVCKYSIPFTTAIDHSNAALLSGIMSSATAAVNIGGVIAGGSPAGLLNATGSIASAAGSFLQAAEHKSTINRGGCLSGAPGWMMPRKPALIITIPDTIRPDTIYNNTTGYPTFKSGLLADYNNNYVEVAQIGLKALTNQYGANPNDSELDMIKSTLKGGVYV